MLYKSTFKVIRNVLLVIAVLPHIGPFKSVLGNLFKSSREFSPIVSGLIVGIETIKFLIKESKAVIENELIYMTPDEGDIFDFVVVGAGSAGATIAARLSEVANISVLLIEAGKAENRIMDIPLLATYLQLDETINWDYNMKSSPNYCLGMHQNQCKMPRGKVMGGSSVLNFMIAQRGSRYDYDHWAEIGCDGWSWNDVYPIFKNLENFEVNSPEIDMKYHGTGGPLNIARAPYHTKASHAFLEAGKERGFPIIDYNGKETIGYSLLQATVKNGARFSSNRAYLYPAKNRSNLFFTKRSLATKILIDRVTKRAYGVEIRKKFWKTIRVLARKEVIVSAGVIESPKLLMLSGIGPEAHLREHNIPVLKDAPVGENLMDHISYYGLNFLVNDSVTLVAQKVFNPLRKPIFDYVTKHEGPISVIGGCEAAAFVDIKNLSARQSWPDMELLMLGTSVGSDPLAHIAFNIATLPYLEYYKPILGKQSFMIVPTLIQPKSRGRVLLKSNKYKDHPVIIPNYFDDPEDMERMILGIRESLKLAQTQALQKYDCRLPDYPVPGCENYETDSDAYWDCAARTFSNTLYHLAGTCKMGAANDSTAVVDPRLKVIGIQNLRVADSSIIPVIPAGHINVPTIMIGEKLAQMLKEDWNLTL